MRRFSIRLPDSSVRAERGTCLSTLMRIADPGLTLDSALARAERCPILRPSAYNREVARLRRRKGAEGVWWLRRSSKPCSPARTRVGGFDSHTFPYVAAR